MKKTLILIALAGAGVLAGCQSEPTKSEPAMASSAPAGNAQMQYESALNAAKKALKEAAAADNVWRDSGKILKSAEAAAAKGDFGVATKLANQAEAQGMDAVQQAHNNVNAGNPSYLY
jgi:ribonuclease HI